MKSLFRPEMVQKIIIVFVLLLGMKLFWFFVTLEWLYTVDIDQERVSNIRHLYYRVRLTPNEAPAPVPQKVQVATKIVEGNIKDIKLLAIYHSSEMTVVTVEYKKGTRVLVSGDAIDGFILDDAGNNFATFIKNNKRYKVLLVKSVSNTAQASITRAVSSASISKVKKNLGGVIDAGDHKIIDRSLLEHYANNINEVYKEIGVGEVKRGNDLVGFRISYVKRDSPFAKLGVRRNDIIKSINGQAINSYSVAFGIYKNIKNMENLSLVIERGTEEMELEYEIN
jgi:general secretion pathway protein C